MQRASVPVLEGVVVLFDSRVDWVGCADLKFESLNFSIDVVVVSIGGGWFVKKVEEYRHEDERSDKRIEHRHIKSQGKILSL
jgi:hypothetical protein